MGFCTCHSITSQNPSIVAASAFAATGFTHKPQIRVLNTQLGFSPKVKTLAVNRRVRVIMSCGKMELDKGRDAGDVHGIDEELVSKMVYDALVWCSLHGLVVGDRNVERSGTTPGVGLVHAPISLLPVSFSKRYWDQACELAPLFNELVDRVSLDAEFLQDTLSRTKKVDAFTAGLLDIHSRVTKTKMKEDIRLGLHRSDYMLDEQTNLLLQIEMNTISCSFPGLSARVSELHRSILSQYGKHLGLNHKNVPDNPATSGFAEALAKAWSEYGNTRAVVLIVVQPEERNMYDQHWLSTTLREKHNVRTMRKTLAEIAEVGVHQPNGMLLIGDEEVAVVYFRAGYAPTDYPTEAEWTARLLIEQSSAVKCPSISYHLSGTKKVQQELAKPGVLERFVDNKEDIAKLRKCFAGLWSLDDAEIIKDAIERSQLYVMKPQREGGGNNIYGDDVRERLLRLRREGSEENAAYILMQRIFPQNPQRIFPYQTSNDKVIVNDQCGYLMRTKVSSSNEGGVAAGFAVLDSIHLT